MRARGVSIVKNIFLLSAFCFLLSDARLWADSVTLKSGRVISGEILDEWDGRILMEVKKGITMIFDRKDVKKVMKDKPPPAPVKKPAVKKPVEPVEKESSSVSSSTSAALAPPASPTSAIPEKAPGPAPTSAPAR